MSGTYASQAVDRRARHAAIPTPRPPEVKSSLEKSASTSSAASISDVGTSGRPPVGRNVRQQQSTSEFMAGLEEKRGSGLPRPAVAESVASTSKTSNRARKPSTGWGKSSVTFDEPLASSQSQSPKSSTSSGPRKKKASNAIDFEDNFDGSDDEMQLKPGVKRTSRADEHSYLFSSPADTANEPERKRKVSSTKSEGAKDSPKRIKSSDAGRIASRPAPKSASKAQVPAAGSSRSKSSDAPRSKPRPLDAVEVQARSKSTSSKIVVEIHTSSPARPALAAKRALSTDTEELSEVDERPAKPKVRLTGKSSSMASGTARSATVPAVRPKPSATKDSGQKAGALAGKSTNAQSSSTSTVTPRPRPRPKPTADRPGKAAVYQSGGAPRASSTESEGVMVVSSSGAGKKPAVRSNLAGQRGVDELSVSSNKENPGTRIKPVPTAIARQKGPTKSKPARTVAGSSATKSLERRVSGLNVADSSRDQRTLKETSPVRQRTSEKKKGKKRLIAESTSEDEDNEANELFGNATQAAWISNAFSGRDVDGLEAQYGADNGSESEVDEGISGEPPDGTSLCPFCDGPLPETLSQSLYDTLVRLCRRLDVKVRSGSSNPTALFLEASATAEVCKRHRDEHTLIPDGIRQGYPPPGSIDFSALRERFMAQSFAYIMVLVGAPTLSPFFEQAKEAWDHIGARRMGNVVSQFSTFQQELPGYYGPQGLEILKNVLEQEIVGLSLIIPSLIKPLDVESYIRRVLVPEAAVRLIQEDQQCEHDAAVTILHESRAYGAAAFALGDSETVPESQEELKQRKKDSCTLTEKREALLRAGGEAARGIRLADKAIEQLKAHLPE